MLGSGLIQLRGAGGGSAEAGRAATRKQPELSNQAEPLGGPSQVKCELAKILCVSVYAAAQEIHSSSQVRHAPAYKNPLSYKLTSPDAATLWVWAVRNQTTKLIKSAGVRTLCFLLQIAVNWVKSPLNALTEGTGAGAGAVGGCCTQGLTHNSFSDGVF